MGDTLSQKKRNFTLQNIIGKCGVYLSLICVYSAITENLLFYEIVVWLYESLFLCKFV